MKKGFLIALCVLLFGTPILAAESSSSKDAVKKVSPYLLPGDHPIRPALDHIFSNSRVLLNLKTLRKAGFYPTKPRKYTSLIVAKHPDLQGYILKIYLDAQQFPKDQPEYYLWIKRIKGAAKIRALVNSLAWQEFFKIPKKWIYMLPENPSPPPEYRKKISILIEEDMDLYSDQENKYLWKTVSSDYLEKVYHILETLGLRDCAKPDNIPFTRFGGVAFIDTQTYGEWPVSYHRLKPFLSPENQSHWKKIIKKARKN